MARLITGDHKISNLEAQHRFQDKAASIDDKLDEALSKINWDRRNKAESSLSEWVKTYCIGLLLDEVPPEKGEQVLEDMEQSIQSHSNYMVCLHRGAGKSSYTLCTTLYAALTGKQKFIVIISNNARAAAGLLNDLWRAIQEKDTALANDYPTAMLPFHLCGGSFRRRQTYKGQSTELQKNAGNIVFARLKDDNCNEYPTSGSIITVRGITSGIRGLKHGTMRPTMVILDDLQTTETAENPESVQKILNTINKDIIPLAGKERLSILQTATPIVPEDVVEKIRADTNWHTTLYPAIISYPQNKELWKEYFKIFDTENVEEKPHDNSLKFYKDNRVKMDEGSEVFNPSRYSSKDGHISAIQKLLEIKHVIGDSAFQSEYQMKPLRYSFSIDITPKKVIQRISNNPQFIVPDGYVFVSAASDLNLSYCISTTIIAYKVDMTAVMIGHIFKSCSISNKLTDTEYNQKVYEVLAEHGRELKTLNIPRLKWGIDANGLPFDAVTSFCNNSRQVCGIQAIGMIGRSSHLWTDTVRSKLRNGINRTVLCGDAEEHVKSGAGKKWIAFDTDYYREKVQKSMMAEIGSAGSLCLYEGTVDEHTEFANQFCNERLLFVKHRQDGRNQYCWKSAEPHDMLDSTSMNFALCSSQGISGQNFEQITYHKPLIKRKQHIKII